MNELFQKIVASKDTIFEIGQVFGVLIIGFLLGVGGIIRKKKLWILGEKKKTQVFVEKHSRIHEMLTELRVTIRASRCLVFQFHNGGRFSDGTSIKRFSVTHESCNSGVTSVILESQDVLLTRYMDLIQILGDSEGKIIRTDSISASTFRSCLEINNVEYFSVVPLRCVDSLSLMGFVCCHWCSSEPLDEIENEGIKQESLEEIIVSSTNTINSYLALKAETKGKS